jgi:hypothetical protein
VIAAGRTPAMRALDAFEIEADKTARSAIEG